MSIAQQPTLDTLWKDARAGRIPWSAVQEHQADMMPRCVNHAERSAPVYWDEAALCADCYAAIVIARQIENGKEKEAAPVQDTKAVVSGAISPAEAVELWHRIKGYFLITWGGGVAEKRAELDKGDDLLGSRYPARHHLLGCGVQVPTRSTKAGKRPEGERT